ncbi:acetyl-CoA C-acyltransferase [Roseospira marina]|uniref:Acetyl-CoA C-acyltransferase n=1 Tax=Roseospira marina TaxID=140057 RepID=A0A5M6IF81_9PROT|nr:acetyl-CoA C-acyltransferase [Roseospira marina]KAA5606940.1 acetyl-CoA C-acyltransferase [Roseospira marina]MBB4312885.1 acetyl-CoA C-acetyltransferase [Roseospira marina]MBB5086342.1 acetyl-CoA C-acetyltransferase [Roseospira marina]
MTVGPHRDPVVIVGAVRTPLGGFQGELAIVTVPALGAHAIGAALDRAGVPADAVDGVLMGCVLNAGLGQAPARQAAHAAGLPWSVGCTTISKVCGSAMRAAMLGHDEIIAGSADVIVAGGMESMSNAPYLLDKARGGYRLGHGQVRDHMFLDGLEDAYDPGRLMGTFAEDCADQYGFSRADQDAFAIGSLERAQTATADGVFAAEIAPLTVSSGKAGTTTVYTDQTPRLARPEKIPTLKPAFRADGTVTAANSSSISDGAAALVLTRASVAEAQGWTPLARIVGHATHAREPHWFTTAPIGAVETLLARVGWSVSDVDLWEVNEAFAVVAMAAQRDLGIPYDRLNVHGGACALGHPIGASGARIIVTLLNALRVHGQRRGVATLCIGGGEATALAVEMMA